MNFQALSPDDDEEDQFAPMQAPQLDVPPMALGTRAPLQATPGNTGGGGGADTPPPSVPGIAIMQPPERSDKAEHRGEQVNQAFTQISPEAANDIGQMGMAHGDAQRARAEQAKTREPVAEINALGAEKQAIALQLAEARKQEAIAKAEPQIKAAVAADHQATQEMEANRKFSDYWEDKGTPTKLFAALLVGLNQYAVTGRGMGGHNMAWEIFQNAAAADRQRKVDRFNASKDMSELRKKDVGAANEALKGKLAQLDNEAVAMGKAYAAQTKAYAERLGKPAALAAAAETDAKASALEAETRLKQRKDYEKKYTVEGERDDSGHVINTPAAGSKDSSQSGPRQAAEGHAQIADSMKRFAELNADPKVVAEVQMAIKAQQKVDAANSGVLKPFIQLGKAGELIPMNLGSRLHTDKAREYFALMAPAIAAKAREMDPQGAINDSSLNKGEEFWNFGNARPQQLAAQAREYEKRKGAMAEAAVPGWMATRGRPAAAPGNGRPAPQAPAKGPDPRAAQRDFIEAKQMLMKLPKNSPERQRWQRIHDHLLETRGR